MATVTCILPVYNGARFLRESIDSVLGQDLPPSEVIVIDDGSTDSTWEIVRSYGPRVRAIRQENAGPAAARNRGLALASGDFIAFQDADDLWMPTKLSLQLSRFAADPDLYLSYGFLQNFWAPEMKDLADRLKDHPISLPQPSHGPPLLLARREAFNIVGPFDESLRRASDTDWHYRARESGLKWELLPDVLILRRRHGMNITANWDAGARVTLDLLRASLARRRRKAPIPGSGGPPDRPTSEADE